SLCPCIELVDLSLNDSRLLPEPRALRFARALTVRARGHIIATPSPSIRYYIKRILLKEVEPQLEGEKVPPASPAQTPGSNNWLAGVSRYQWLVLLVAWLGWVFDSMDGTLYSLVQRPSMIELLGPGATEPQIAFYSRVVLAVMLIGWAAGGIFFGALADYIGRTKALVLTVLIYLLFTGLSAAA